MLSGSWMAASSVRRLRAVPGCGVARQRRGSARGGDRSGLRATSCLRSPRRTAGHPPTDHLSLLPDGRVRYRLKQRYRDGSTHVVLDPLTFLERLCALVPRPRRRMLTYHGVLATAARAADSAQERPPPPDRPGWGRDRNRGPEAYARLRGSLSPVVGYVPFAAAVPFPSHAAPHGPSPCVD